MQEQMHMLILTHVQKRQLPESLLASGKTAGFSLVWKKCTQSETDFSSQACWYFLHESLQLPS